MLSSSAGVDGVGVGVGFGVAFGPGLGVLWFAFGRVAWGAVFSGAQIQRVLGGVGWVGVGLLRSFGLVAVWFDGCDWSRVGC